MYTENTQHLPGSSENLPQQTGRVIPELSREEQWQTDPLWYRDAVIYQLHVKSFFDSNNDGVGDFPGLLQKLDYIAELGVDTLWLLPFYPSPRRDDGYDISEYRDVHPDYGTLEDAKRFVDEAHRRGLRVITELVINHTSDQHPWFQAAREAPPGSPARDYYVWSDTDDKYRGTRIIFCDTEKSNWTWDEKAKAYFWHRFYSHQPDLNFENPRVMAEVLNTMRFWLEIGVDGLRLDAVPYLIEREGTSNENLPETHEILKTIRSKLEEDFHGRMLLAEANMWPEDTQQYFGRGDECQMAFHFPLMPRMYMAIAQEDRFPITDILRQTPDIPEGCQWAIFLRNHDELTLEMVTDKERDYLWNTYAADKRARINLGIRRRLAPLLERDRRRIELMNGLLLSMPGTPVIYYGDEIGMGDNIFLGDRDGVRTPMQWSVDRNGGFSKADPAGLVLPPIQDPLYGFQAVNVEAQARDPSSLLNWMRRMLQTRRRSRAFGRGTMRLLYPGNRKVLAYLREHEGETILCVYNLSRAAQAVELDLAAFAGRVPVEMLGGTAFPGIGQLTYLLTLPPYGFYWFLLATEQALPAWHEKAPEPLPDLRTIVFRAEDTGIGPAQRRELEREVLPSYLPKRRWFASKGEKLEGVRLVALGHVPHAPYSTLAELEVSLPGRTERYCLPLSGVEESETVGPLASQLALSRIRQGRRVGYLTDAFASDDFVRGVLLALRGNDSVATDDGEVRFRGGERLDAIELPLAPDADLHVRRLSAEQSNSSMIVAEAVVLKILRKLAPGIHPEAEMTRHLTEAGFANIAPLLGEVVRTGADGVPCTLMLLQGFVRNQGDGWVWTLDWLKRAVDEAALAETPPEDSLAGYLSFAAALGRRLGELHAVLAAPSADPAFAPEEAGAADRGRWAEGALAQLEPALDLLAQQAEWPDEATGEVAARLLAQREGLVDAVHGLAQSAAGALKTRVHGDFHLGQVLVAQGDAVIVDFEGEPARPLEERRAKGSPLRDVAGLLRSFDYAAAVAAQNDGAATLVASQVERRNALLDRFRREASATFLDAYRAVEAAAPVHWSPPESERALLDLFLLEKAAYEVRYEAANRPAWIGVPVRGLAALAASLVRA
ncbi:maltose alpha-D-glucosyltransferase [Roseomonas sp. NAR14]|uniref:maltose alpha-D-glucosyltransferase n=1 Tax=Roseomonas acroporae TaxID=2937791 RepID=A0A9X2BTA2_9PROT|nr:maltose alpha-D-glucosyltransferase [Roseomonas acroporae]MCK8784047.1 maltose alpha-D-glucosyltransferase [Roseomonas acroporae]